MKGLQFQHSSSGGVDGYNFGQQTAVKIHSANDVTVSNCEFSHIGMIGVWVGYSNRVTISNSVFFDVGYHGIMTFGGRSSKVYKDIMVTNNHLDGCGVSHFWQPACIWADGDKNITVSNNEVTNVPNHGIRYVSLIHLSDR